MKTIRMYLNWGKAYMVKRYRNKWAILREICSELRVELVK
jgi:hypothetical protein